MDDGRPVGTRTPNLYRVNSESQDGAPKRTQGKDLMAGRCPRVRMEQHRAEHAFSCKETQGYDTKYATISSNSSDSSEGASQMDCKRIA